MRVVLCVAGAREGDTARRTGTEQDTASRRVLALVRV